MSDADNQRKKPDWSVRVKRGDDLGSSIGVGFNHKAGGGGITLLLDAQPIPKENGQIELVVFPISSNE